MKIEKIITTTETIDQEFLGLTLLSKEEFLESRERIDSLDTLWWLRSPGCCYSDSASYVGIDGSLCSYGSVRDTDGSVRPALILKSCNLLIGNKFKFYNHNWTVISDEYALCDEKFCCMAFRKDWEEKDANDYETSDVKRYLDHEWQKIMEGEQIEN